VKALIHENVPLAPLTTFKIGGPARYFIDAHSQEAVLEAIQFAKHNSVPILVLGGGSNLLAGEGQHWYIPALARSGISLSDYVSKVNWPASSV
jgi:UDP-N-acetylmuramate dehydrogenase